MPVAFINAAPVLPVSTAPSAATVPGTAPSAACVTPSDGLEPDFQSVLSGQRPSAAPAADALTPGTVASAPAAGPGGAGKVSSKAFSAIAAATAPGLKTQVAPAGAPTLAVSMPSDSKRPAKGSSVNGNSLATQGQSPTTTSSAAGAPTAFLPTPIEALADAVAAQAVTPGTVESIEAPVSTTGRLVPSVAPNAVAAAAIASGTTGEGIAPAPTAPGAAPIVPATAPANVTAPDMVEKSGTLSTALTAAPVVPGTVASIAASLAGTRQGAAPSTAPA
ncbi:MAG TPA: hypothetical protein VGF85_03720, partial [Opitutaceae bacterium]